MSKQIRLSDPTYLRLETIREKRETFSMVIDKLIDTYIIIEKRFEAMRSSHYLMERPPKEKGDRK